MLKCANNDNEHTIFFLVQSFFFLKKKGFQVQNILNSILSLSGPSTKLKSSLYS